MILSYPAVSYGEIKPMTLSQRVRPACCMVGLSEKSGAKGAIPKRSGGWGWPKYGPAPVRSKASDHDKATAVMSRRRKKSQMHPTIHAISIHYSERAGISPPCTAQSARTLTLTRK